MISDEDRASHIGLYESAQHSAYNMTQAELEMCTVEALRNYRASVTMAESARLQWNAAAVGLNGCSDIKLRDAYEKAELQHRARQLVLNHLIDRLGFVPILRD